MRKDEAEKALRETLAGRVDYYKSQAELLAGIKRVYKKDGKSFADLRKCFELDEDVAKKYEARLDWKKSIFADDPRKSLEIHWKQADGHADVIYFTAYENITERDTNWEEMKRAGRITEGGEGLKDFYELTPEELAANIKKEADMADGRGKYMEDTADDTMKQGLRIFDLLTEVVEIREKLGKNWEDPASVNRHYMVREALESLFDRMKY